MSCLRTLARCAVAASVYLTLFAAPAQGFPSDVPLMGLFMQADGSGATALGFAPPSYAVPKSTPIYRAGEGSPAPPCAGGAGQVAPTCPRLVIGEVAIERGFTLVGRSGLNLWLRTDAGRVQILDLEVALVKLDRAGVATTLVPFRLAGGQSSAVAAMPHDIAQEAVHLNMASTLSTVKEVQEGDRLQLVLNSIRATPATSAAVNLQVVHSISQPSGAILEFRHNYASWAFGMRHGENTLGVYLGNATLAFQRPTEDPPLRRPLGSALSMQNPNPIVWGPTPLDEAATILGGGTYHFHLRTVSGAVGDHTTPGAAAVLGLTVTLQIGDQRFTSSSPRAISPLTGSGLAVYAGALHVPRMDVAAGTPISLGLSATGSAPSGGVEVVYGSANQSGGLVLPVLGGGTYIPPPPPADENVTDNLTDNTTEAPAEPTSPTSSGAPAATEPLPTETLATQEPTGPDEAASPAAQTDVLASGRASGVGILPLLVGLGPLMLVRRRA